MGSGMTYEGPVQVPCTHVSPFNACIPSSLVCTATVAATGSLYSSGFFILLYITPYSSARAALTYLAGSKCTYDLVSVSQINGLYYITIAHSDLIKRKNPMRLICGKDCLDYYSVKP